MVPSAARAEWPPTGIGLWAGFLDGLPASRAIAMVGALEAVGVETIWLQEYSGVDPFVRAAMYLTATSRLSVGIGVAVIYGRDPEAMVAVSSTLEEAFPDRFILGLGVSHRHLVEARGHDFRPPTAAMESYLAAMDRVRRDRKVPLRVLGALGPRMAALAGRATDGAHTYFGPVEHTAEVRAAVGPLGWLAPTQLVALAGDDERWRDNVRSYLKLCIAMPNYERHLRRLGFTEQDLAVVSERLVDALVVSDAPAQIRARIESQRAAGADHVVLQFAPPPSATAVVDRLNGLLPDITLRQTT